MANPKTTNSVSPTIIASQSQTFFVGPIPPPQILAEYEKVLPGLAAKMLEMAQDQIAMAKRQGEHRMELEKIVIGGDNTRANWGLVSASVLAPATLGAGTWLVYTGHDTAGAGIIMGTVVGLVSAFLYGTSSRRKEREEKAKIQASAPAKTTDDPGPGKSADQSPAQLPPQGK